MLIYETLLLIPWLTSCFPTPSFKSNTLHKLSYGQNVKTKTKIKPLFFFGFLVIFNIKTAKTVFCWFDCGLYNSGRTIPMLPGSDQSKFGIWEDDDEASSALLCQR